MTQQLDYFFNPNGVAIIGASANPAKLSYGVVKNMKTHNYPGPIYPVNPKGGEILGLPVYTGILEVPDPLDLAVIMIPAPLVPGTLAQCGERGVKVAIVITGGFKEAGPEGAELEASLKRIAEQYRMRLIGPNCVGVMDTHLPLDTTFITQMPEPGAIAFVSHSGAICGGTTDWAISVGVGYSRIATLGNQVDVDIADGLRMTEHDPHTKVINIYAEGLPDGRDFVEAAARIYRQKPIVLLKAGLTSAGTRAVASHTGALAGTERAYRAAAHRAGALVVDSLQQMNDVAMALATQPLPSGNRVVLLTNAGGPAALAADELERQGLVMANLAEETIARLKAVTPRDAQLGNPVDMLGGPNAEMYDAALRILAEDPGVDMLMALFVPQAITPVGDVARNIVKAAQVISTDLVESVPSDAAKSVPPYPASARYPVSRIPYSVSSKPLVACMVGGASIPEAVKLLNRGGVPFYRDPNRAAQALGGLWAYKALRERPDLTPVPLADVDRAAARAALVDAGGPGSGRAEGQGSSEAGEREAGSVRSAIANRFLDAETAARVVAAYGVRVPVSGVAGTVSGAVMLAERSGYPVVLKLIAPDVVHKLDVGGIALDLRDADAVRAACARLLAERPGARVMVQQMIPQGIEVILGAQRDAQFGPLLMFGLGGIYVEVFKDVAFRLAPLCAQDARDMIAETAAGKLLAGVRGQPPGDVVAVVDTLLRVGQLVHDFPCIAELDINPLIVGKAGEGVWAVDVRIAVTDTPED
ncbi:MAG: acetate--CoA ligase family protein [Anaerolineae bacterium]|nr:acetate--CoA ligase family protein [Anaerolineae bacterium]